MQQEHILHLDVAYRVFTSREPADTPDVLERCVAVVEHFNGKKFTERGGEPLDRSLRIATYIVALEWIWTRNVPLEWGRVEGLVREVAGGWVGTREIDVTVLRELLSKERAA